MTISRRRAHRSKLKALANEGEVLASHAMAGFCNASEIGGDGWTLIPFGEWPHAEGIQLFGQKQAERIVDNFKSGWGRFKRALVGLPVFKGHPDLKGLENAYPDKTEYGQIADMEVRPQGLAIKQVLSEGGARLVQAGLRFISPHWLANAVGDRNGVTIYEPTVMKSVGLTNKPNIPNKSLVNEATISSAMNPKLLAFLIETLALKPIANATEVTDAQVEEALRALAGRPTVEALANEQTQRISATTRAETAERELAKTKTDLETAAKALANDRKVNIEALVNQAVAAGKITQAEKPLWTKRLENDFDGEAVALGNAQALKTTPTTEQKRLAELDRKLRANGGKEIANDADGDTDIGSLVNAELTAMGCTDKASRGKNYNTAFANVKKKHAALFAPANLTPGTQQGV